MIPMTPANARAIVMQLFATKTADVAHLEVRIKDLEQDMRDDPWEGTQAQIERLKTRLVHARLEAEALEIVLKGE